MITEAEVLAPYGTNATGRVILEAIVAAAPEAGVGIRITERYSGCVEWLVIWGVGATGRSEMRDRHVANGGKVQLWDIGFFRRTKRGYCKVSVNQDYATRWLDRTAPEPRRWDEVALELREDADPNGHIVLAGIGPKQHAYAGAVLDDWEPRKLAELRARFPGRRIVYRPKPNRRYVELGRGVEMDAESPIEDVLRGAALAVCMHSNVAVDAVLAGVPYESEDGVSTWLRGKPYTRETRLDFCRRIARWQYKPAEMAEAWRFLLDVTKA